MIKKILLAAVLLLCCLSAQAQYFTGFSVKSYKISSVWPTSFRSLKGSVTATIGNTGDTREMSGIHAKVYRNGKLEDAITKIAALRGNADAHLSDRRLLVFCADNGVVAQGVTQCGSEVTAKVAQALAEGHSSVSPIARAAKCSVTPVDVGILDFPGHPGVLDRRIRNGCSPAKWASATPPPPPRSSPFCSALIPLL